MMRKIKHALARFRKEEDGTALLIEFCIFVPLLFGAFLMAVEMGIYSMRQVYLDRGLDIAVREIRLNTRTQFTHDDIKQIVCDNTGWLENCDETLRLEMVQLNPRVFFQYHQAADCVDTSKPIEPVRGFNLGRENEMMMVRACVKFDPIFPTSGLGKEFAKDGTGRATMISAAAFVQEPG